MESYVLFNDKEMTLTDALRGINARMLEIERENMDYNKATDFGQNPNGQEARIVHILKEWDHLKIRRQRLKELN